MPNNLIIQDLIANRLTNNDFNHTEYSCKFSALQDKITQIKKDPNNKLLDFGIGESELMPAMSVLNELVVSSYQKENRGYTDNGFIEFNQCCVEYLSNLFNVNSLDAKSNICMCLGAKSAHTLLAMSFIDSFDYVITTTPGYHVLDNYAKWLNGNVYSAPLYEENHYLPDLETIPEEIYKKAKIFIINYPNNPTGAVANKTFYQSLIKKALKYGFIIVNDCVYGGLVYNIKPLSILSIKDSLKCCVEIHSMSKSFNMTGMRIGFLAGNEDIINVIKQVKDNTDSGQYKPIMLAAMKAMNNYKEILYSLQQHYYSRMKSISKVCNSLGLTNVLSKATFYLYCKIPEGFTDALTFSKILLEKANIYTIPYDEADHFIRLSMTFDYKGSLNEVCEQLTTRINKILMSITFENVSKKNKY